MGGIYLWTRSKGVRDAGHSLTWCLGASFARLLPVIPVTKEFGDFFDDPGRTRLTGWQTFVFSVVGPVGFVLGGILLAAISGLIQGS